MNDVKQLFWRFYAKIQFWAIPLPEINFWGHFKILLLKVRYLKVPSKVDFGQKRSPKTHILGFFNGTLPQKPKICIFGVFFGRNQLLRALQDSTFESSLSKSALKSWFWPKKTPKNAYFGFFNGLFGAKNPKYAFFSSFYLPESTFEGTLRFHFWK